MARIRRYLGRVELWLDDRERAALSHAVDHLADDSSPDGEPVEGSGRLAGRAYQDPEMEAEYQRYTAPDVVAAIRADVDAVRADLGGRTQPLRLDDDRALTWLRALNHLRLIAGEHLGIQDDGWEDGAPVDLESDERWAMLLDLGWFQEGIVAALEG